MPGLITPTQMYIVMVVGIMSLLRGVQTPVTRSELLLSP